MTLHLAVQNAELKAIRSHFPESCCFSRTVRYSSPHLAIEQTQAVLLTKGYQQVAPSIIPLQLPHLLSIENS